MTQREMIKDQLEFARKMHESEPLHVRLSPNPAQEKLNGRKVYVDGFGWGTIKGGYLNSDQSAFLFTAFHIIFNNGVRTTVEASKVIKYARA